jgi:hypothetical protein
MTWHAALPRAPILHPISLGDLTILIVNDHVLKHVCPSFLTGKLSGFAGMLLMPLVLTGMFELLAKWLGRPPDFRMTNLVLVLATSATMFGYTLVELWEPAETAYRFTWGTLQWPFRATFSLFRHEAIREIRPVSATADLTDLLALPMGFVALGIGWRRTHTDTDVSGLAHGGSVVRSGSRQTGTA